jgi:hypothetical protein
VSSLFFASSRSLYKSLSSLINHPVSPPVAWQPVVV